MATKEPNVLTDANGCEIGDPCASCNEPIGLVAGTREVCEDCARDAEAGKSFTCHFCQPEYED